MASAANLPKAVPRKQVLAAPRAAPAAAPVVQAPADQHGIAKLNESLMMEVTAEGKQAWQSVRTRKAKYAIWKIDEEKYQITLEKLGEKEETPENFLSSLSDIHCRYTVIDHEYLTRDGRKTSKILFISWTPQNSNQNDKIMYSQQRHKFKESLHGTVQHNVNTKREIQDALLKAEGKEEKEDDDNNDID